MAAKFAIAAALLLTLTGTAFAQELDEAPTGFYADPVLSDPPPVPVHAFNPAVATSEVAVVTPAADLAPAPGAARPRAPSRNEKVPARSNCTALNPCATNPQAAHG